MKYLTGISQGLVKWTKATLQNNYTITIKSVESLKLLCYEEVAGR